MLICKKERDVIVEREVVIKTMCDICNNEWRADYSGWRVTFDNEFLIGNDPVGQKELFHVCRNCFISRMMPFLSVTGLPIALKEESGGRVIDMKGNRKTIIEEENKDEKPNAVQEKVLSSSGTELPKQTESVSGGVPNA